MRYVLLAFALAGCQLVFPQQSPDALGTTPDDARDGRDAPVDLLITPADRDGDGILNENDGCPDAFDPTQHDEDEDQVPDACDRCPHLAGTSGNTDGDHLDNACDPFPATQECIVKFDGFEVLAGWESVQGNWSISGDEVSQSSPSASMLVTPNNIADAYVIAAGTVEAVLDPDAAFGVWTAVTETGPETGLLVELTGTPDRMNTEVVATRWVGGNETRLSGAAVSPVSPLNPPQAFAIEIERSNGMLRAVGSLASSAATTTIVQSNPTGRVGIRTSAAFVAFKYILIAERRASCPPR
jgi:hypothetical protein